MNKIIVCVSIAVAAGGGYWVGKGSTPPVEVASASEVAGHSEPPPSSAVTRPEVAFKENCEPADIPSDSAKTPSEAKESAASNQSQERQIDALRAEYELKKRSDSFTSWLVKNYESESWFDIGTEMRSRFEGEETDYNWASYEEGRLQSVFTEKQALAGIAVKSTECKSTQCQITVSVMNHDHANEVTTAITETLGEEKFSHIIVDSQVGQGETIFYVSSNEKGFEFN